MGPLAGLKVIEMKGIGPGPYAGMILADLGAEVVVVERASKPSSIAPPSELDVHSRGKKSIALNVKTPEGLDALLRLIDSADGLIEGYRPGVAERLGFGPDVCLARNPRLVFGRMTGWGQSGPLATSAGHDYNYISLTGAAAAIGTQNQPVPPLNIVGDFAGGSLFLVVGMLAAIMSARETGKGQVVDTAITDGSAHLMSVFYTLSRLGAWNTQRESNLLDGGMPFYRAYATADGRYVSVGPIEPQFFAEMITLLGLPEALIARQNDPGAAEEIADALAHCFKQQTRDHWMSVFEGTDACVAGVLDFGEAPSHPHNQARETYIEVAGVTQPAPAPRFSATPCPVPDAPTAEGADTRQVLADWGFSSEDLEKLERGGALT